MFHCIEKGCTRKRGRVRTCIHCHVFTCRHMIGTTPNREGGKEGGGREASEEREKISMPVHFS